ncbi:MAG: outer membrane lipoprotein-sorting protein [Magnetococcales bacterium]|nr:outer membrane lipoprotein-sorting protein [Magnetococcales bacterium]
MTLKQFFVGGMAALSLTLSSTVSAGVSPDLPYPKDAPTAEEIARQVYFVNHFFAVKDFSIERDGRTVITSILSRSKGSKAKVNTVERYLNNDYSDGVVRAKDLAIFRSGKLRGTGMLIVDYVDDDKSQSYSIWLPALRKIRRFTQPAHDDSWGGTDFTFGDVTLRKPHHENHELLGTESFEACLMAIELPEGKRSKYTKNLHPAACDHKGSEVYKLKSTTKYESWWYDHRISYVDTKTFADYRTEYFKDGKKIKIIDRDWTSMKLDDPRGLAWRYWYGVNLESGHETMANIPDAVVHWNSGKESSLWTENTLRKIKR